MRQVNVDGLYYLLITVIEIVESIENIHNSEIQYLKQLDRGLI